ncbi:MAG: hypothetical protein QM756_21695 [Polyangiaceae bacterium]
MKNSFRLTSVSLLVLGALAAAMGCSSSDAKAETATSSCAKFCTVEDHCDATTTVDDCNSYRCDPIADTNAECQKALKAFYDCMLKASDVCVTTSCETEEVAYHNVC